MYHLRKTELIRIYIHDMLLIPHAHFYRSPQEKISGLSHDSMQQPTFQQLPIFTSYSLMCGSLANMPSLCYK